MKKVLFAATVVLLLVLALLWLGPCEDGVFPVGEGEVAASDDPDPSQIAPPTAPLRYVRADSPFADGLQEPNRIVQLADSRVLVREYSGGRVLEFSADGGQTPAPIVTGAFGQGGIGQLGDGHVWVGVRGGVAAYDRDGTSRGQVVDASAFDIVPLQDGGALLVQIDRVLKVAADGTLASQPFMTSPSRDLYGAHRLADGRVLVLHRGTGEVIEVSADGTAQATFATGRVSPMDAAQLADGRVLIAEGNGDISMFDADGTPADSAFATGLSGLSDIVRLADGRVLAVQRRAGRITEFVPVQ